MRLVRALRTSGAVSGLQGAQSRSTCTWVPPVKSRPGLSGAWIEGLSQQSASPSTLRAQASRDPIQAMRRWRLMRNRGEGTEVMEDIQARPGWASPDLAGGSWLAGRK